MTVKDEYECMKSHLRMWNQKSNWEATEYRYRIEHYTKKSQAMMVKLLNADFEKMNFDIKYGFITPEGYNQRWKVWNECSDSIANMEII